MLTNILKMIYNTSRALKKVFGVWLSLVEYLVWDQGAAGSNPVTPMKGFVEDKRTCGLSRVLLS